MERHRIIGDRYIGSLFWVDEPVPMILKGVMAFTGQIGQKANWANCFFQCVQGMLRIISIIYIIINVHT